MPTTWPSILGLANPPLEEAEELRSQLGALPGWAVFHRSMARDAQVYSGDDFRPYTDAGVGVICCLEWDREDGGTIPAAAMMKAFLDRCSSYAEASEGCHVWVIGSEMNCVSRWPLTAVQRDSLMAHPQDWEVLEPRYRLDRYPVLTGHSEAAVKETHFPLTPEYCADCYLQARDRIKAIPGHEKDLVLTGAVAPWNRDFRDPGNPSGDWTRYFARMAAALKQGQCDGFAMHTATLGPDPELLDQDRKLSFPFDSLMAGFRSYEDFAAAIPSHHRELPVFITEASQLRPWLDANDGWVANACALVQKYNRGHSGPPVRCLTLFQWGGESPWGIRGKSHLIVDIRDSLASLAAQARSASLCDVSWSEMQDSLAAPAKGPVRLEVRVTNPSGENLHCSGDDPVRLAAALLPRTEAKETELLLSDLRMPLPEDLPAGGELSWSVELPEFEMQESQYALFLGLVRSQFVWSAAELPSAFSCLITQERHADEAGEPVDDCEEQIPRSTPEDLDPEPPEAAKPSTEEKQQLPFDTEETDESEAETSVTDSTADGTGEEQHPSEDQLPGQGPEEHAEAVRGNVPAEAISASERVADTAPDAADTDCRIVNLSSFVQASMREGKARPVGSLRRIVFVDSGLESSVPLEEFQAHFRKLGYEGIPIHFLLTDGEEAFQLLPISTPPHPYSRNLEAAVVLGLEGSSSSQAEGHARLQRAAWICASILRHHVPFGLTPDLEVGLDSLDGSPAFAGLPPEILEEACGIISDHWMRLGMYRWPLSLVPVDLPLEARTEDEGSEIEAAPDLQTPSEEGPPSAQDGPPSAGDPVGAASLGPIPETQWSMPSRPEPYPLRLGGSISERLKGENGRHRAVAFWAAGDSGEMPLTELQRLHGLATQSGFFHFVIDASGRPFETRSAPDSKMRAGPERDGTVHIGLQGDFRLAAPDPSQTVVCGQLLALLSGRDVQLNPSLVTVGTQQWFRKEEWLQRVMRQSEEFRSSSGSVRDGSISTDPVGIPQEPEISESTAGPPAESNPAEELAERAAFGTSEAKPPPINNIVDLMPSHPRMRNPVRDGDAIRGISIHHSDAPFNVTAEQLAESWILDHVAAEHDFPGLPYHYFIHADGRIDHCTRMQEVCEAASHGNEALIVICLAGRFTDSLNPTPAQLKQTGKLIRWLAQEHDLNIEAVSGHRDLDEAETVCPGEEWDQGRNWKETLLHYATA